MNYENSLKEIISNHLLIPQEELDSFSLSHGIAFYDKNGISRIITGWIGELKPTENEVVRIVSAKEMLDASKASNKMDKDYEINREINSIIFTYYR